MARSIALEEVASEERRNEEVDAEPVRDEEGGSATAEADRPGSTDAREEARALASVLEEAVEEANSEGDGTKGEAGGEGEGNEGMEIGSATVVQAGEMALASTRELQRTLVLEGATHGRDEDEEVGGRRESARSEAGGEWQRTGLDIQARKLMLRAMAELASVFEELVEADSTHNPKP